MRLHEAFTDPSVHLEYFFVELKEYIPCHYSEGHTLYTNEERNYLESWLEFMFVTVTIQLEVSVVEEPCDMETPRLSSSIAPYSLPKKVTSCHSTFRQWLTQLQFIRKQ
jgi:Zn-dependent M16 (insulinase) family peptidase